MAPDYSKLKVTELKAELKRLGLPQNGLKADLIARLEASADAPDPEAEAEDADVDDEADAPPPKHEDEEEADAASGNPATATKPEPRPEDAAASNAPVAQKTRTPTPRPATASTQSKAESPVPPASGGQVRVYQSQSTDATPLGSAEILQDTQKRKRRSPSPPPSSVDIARKRARQEEEPEAIGNSQSASRISDEMGRGDLGEPRAGFRDYDSRVDQYAPNDRGESEAAVQNGHPGDSSLGEAEASYRERYPQDSQHEKAQVYNETERDVGPAIHPATAALYIKNFMRPLRESAVQEHLLSLATPADAHLDERTIIDFYLDSIRTHAFVVFHSISAASRVRTALHHRIWPEESNRKALWVDFVPPERVSEWIDEEQSSARSSRGSAIKYEVVYEDDRDGHVTARLAETPASKQQPHPLEHDSSIPTGPSRPSFSYGLENAPLGPRNPGRGSGPPALHPGRFEHVPGGADQPFLSSRTPPSVQFKPVPEELVHRRLSAISAAKARDDGRDFGKEYKRYFFESGDYLVDRGPEIFLGIRPPHRERERRREREQARMGRRSSPGVVGSGGGVGVGGPSFVPNRRGPPPPYGPRQGVPRGGDRYRGEAASASMRHERPPPPPRDDYRGAERHRRTSYNRDPPYSRDPYSRDSYGRDPYSRDPYSRDSYSRDPYSRDAYSSREPHNRYY